VQATRHLYEVHGWGVGEVIVADRVVLSHELPLASAVEWSAEGLSAPRLVTRLADRVRRHLGGEQTSYRDVTIDLSWCTPFQLELAAALQRVPWGEIVSYGELAALAGRPDAARAAGTFCARNRFSLVLPCHRVVSADGIGGYGSSGVALKRRLLALEGIRL
jgi:methylated-DNA-[protein]-cysteine S-methyltransferase